MRRLQRALMLIAAAAFLVSTGGCGKLELNQLAMVMAVGLDKEESGVIKVTAQIVRPTSATGASGGPSGGKGEPVWIVSAEGKSIFEAIRNLGRFTSRRVFWAHNRAIIVGEAFAKDDIRDMLDFFTRNHELRMNTWVLATPGKASDLVATDTGLEAIPGDSIDRMFRFSRIVSEAPRTTIREVMAAYINQTSNPVLAMVKKVKHEYSMDKPSEKPKLDQVELSGAAIFKRGKMLGTLSPSESRGLIWFIEKIESSVISVPCPQMKNRTASLELEDHHFKVTPGFHNGRVFFQVNLQADMNLVELGCPAPQGLQATAESLEKSASAKYKQDIESVLKKAIQVYKTDFLDLGKVFQNRYPGRFKAMADRWPEEFADAETEVTVTLHIKNPILMILPTRQLGVPEEGGDPS